MGLLRVLRQFQTYFELVIFTFLPRRFVDLIFHEIPGMNNYFNQILTAEDCSWQEEYLIKDCSVLLGNRNLLDLYVIETDQSEVDN